MLRAYGGSGSSASGQLTHSVTSARPSELRSKTVRARGGAATKSVANSTEEVLTGRGMDTWIGRPAAINAARAGGSNQEFPSDSNRSAPWAAHSR